ncbi:MAG: hypothetical protein ABIY50_13825 [Ignavibacteria bacterium]
MIELNAMRKFFIYEETSKTVVSVTSGILIAMFNIFSGIIVVYIILQLIIDNFTLTIFSLLIIIPAGIFIGMCFLKMIIKFSDLMLGNTQMEMYSYVRLILLMSVLQYILILLLYSLNKIADFIGLNII